MTARARAINIGADGMAEGRHGNTEAQRAAAARVVAAMSGGAEECAALLAMLGLDAQDALSSSERVS